MTDIGVDVIGKVNRRGASGQVNDVTARGEDVDAVLKYIAPHAIQQIPARHVTSDRHSIILRRELISVVHNSYLRALRLPYIASARQCHTRHSGAFHACGSALRADVCHRKRRRYAGTDRSYPWARRCNHRIHRGSDASGVDHTQRGITGWHIRHDQAHSAHVTHHVEGFTLLLHFFVNRINMFWAPADFGFDVVLFEQFYKVFFYGFKLGFAVWAFFRSVVLRSLYIFQGSHSESQGLPVPI